MSQPRVRAVTVFLQLNSDSSSWPEAICAASRCLCAAKAALEADGFEVQTTRVATNPFGEYVSPGQEVADIQRVEQLCAAAGTGGFLSIGATDDISVVRDVVVPVLRTCLFTSASFDLPQLVVRAGRTAVDGASREQALRPAADARAVYRACAATILDIAEATDGAGNFRFCAAANCPPGLPFFPAARAFSLHGDAPTAAAANAAGDIDAQSSADATGSDVDKALRGASGVQCFAIGTENDGVLAAEFCSDGERASSSSWDVSQRAHDALLPSVQRISQICARVAAVTGVPFLGVDTSVVPGLDTPSLTDTFEAITGVPFGRPGTLAACAAITQALKALPVPQCGYCGMMLPVCEDSGLAAAAAEGGLDVQSLLACSSVCGVGIDTVPCPGRTGVHVSDALLEGAIAGLLMDVACLAHRLDKPLSCRLLPQNGKGAGESTSFDSPYLINSRVMPL